MVNVLGPAPWLAPPMAIGVLLLVWLTAQRDLALDAIFVAILGLLAVCLMPWAWSFEFISAKSLRHVAMVLAAASVFYLALQRGLVRLLLSHGPLAAIKAVYLALLSVSAFILVEWLGANSLVPDLRPYVPYISNPDFEALMFGVLYRARGFATEPGVMALYYDFALFLVLPLLRRGFFWFILYFLVIIPAYLCLLSTASLLCVGASLLLLLVLRFRARVIGTSLLFSAFVLLILGAAILGGKDLASRADELLTSRVVALVTGDGLDTSAATRRGKFGEASRTLEQRPFGVGFGITPGLADVAVSYDGLFLSEGQISMPGTFAIAGGVLGLLVFLALYLSILLASLRITYFGQFIACGGLALGLHQIVISEYWLPFFWIFFAFAMAYRTLPRDTAVSIAAR